MSPALARRRRWPGSFALAAVALCVSLPALGLARGALQSGSLDPLALATELGELREAASDADAALGVIARLTDILEQLDARRDAAGQLPETERELHLRALEYRARAYVTRGSSPAASDDLRLLVLADPTRRLDIVGLSPAVLDLFEAQRTALLAHLSVFTEPPGATVLVGAEPVGTTPLVGHPVFAGRVRIRAERAGYAPVDEGPRDILPGDILSIERELVRTGPVLPVVTSPAGVTVRVGGRVVGVTGGELPEELRPLVPPRFARDEFSAPLDLGDLAAGPNEITLEAPCRRPARFVFHADEARDYLPRFVRLGPSTGGLRIESDPGGGVVFLDGEEQGATPLSFSAMCSGPHVVEIRHPAGRCSRSFDVTRGSRTAVRCEVRPVVVVEHAGPGTVPELDEALRSVLASDERFFLLEEPDPGDRVQVRVRVEVPEPGGGSARIGLLADGSSQPDSETFDRFSPDSAVSALRGLLEAPERRRAWAGFSAAVRRIHGADGERRRTLEVTGLHPGGPAALAGVEPGDEVLEVQGGPVRDELGLLRGVRTVPADATLDLLVRREGADRLLHLVLDETPVLPDGGAAHCNRRLIALEAEFARGVDDPTRRLEAAVCWILLGEPARAMQDHLAGLDSETTLSEAGVGRGTVLFQQGVAFAALGDAARAVGAFEAAAAVPGATLVTHDGPVLAPLALRRAERTR